MIYVGNSLKDAISNTARCLHVIHQEISAPNMQGLFKIQPRDMILLGTGTCWYMLINWNWFLK